MAHSILMQEAVGSGEECKPSFLGCTSTGEGRHERSGGFPGAISEQTRESTPRNMVEAGGVEPPSEKRYEPKPTCLSQFGVRPGPCGLIARSPAALRMSKKRNQLVRWFSPEPYGPKGPGQLTV